MANYASDVVKIAQAEIGYLEKKSNAYLDSKTANAGFGNYTKYANDFDVKHPTFYNGHKNGFAWCDVFVDWLFVQAFGESMAKKLLFQPSKSLGAGVPYSARYYKNNNRFFKSDPRPGDQIFFIDGEGEFCHTGLVYKVDNKKVYTIEGNTSTKKGVVANGGGVCAKDYGLTDSCIGGYGRPIYDPEPVKKPSVPVKTVTKTVTANGGLALRSKPDLQSGIRYCYIPKGVKVTVLTANAATADGFRWAKVKYNGQIGYCANIYLK